MKMPDPDEVFLYQYIIYNGTADDETEAGMFTLRRWALSRRGPVQIDIIGVAETVDKLRTLIPTSCIYYLNRAPHDHPSIVELWV